MFTIEPACWAIIVGATARIPKNTPIALMSITSCHNSAVVSVIGTTRKIPALFTNTSICPASATTRETTRSQSLSEVTSWVMNVAPMSAALLPPCSLSTSVTKTRAPSATNNAPSAAPFTARPASDQCHLAIESSHPWILPHPTTRTDAETTRPSPTQVGVITGCPSHPRAMCSVLGQAGVPAPITGIRGPAPVWRCRADQMGCGVAPRIIAGGRRPMRDVRRDLPRWERGRLVRASLRFLPPQRRLPNGCSIR